MSRYVGLDELEIFGLHDLGKNVASTESGATVHNSTWNARSPKRTLES